MVSAPVRQCCRCGFELIAADTAWTTRIQREFRYRDRYRVGLHVRRVRRTRPLSAAFVIGRRGPGFAERMRNPASPLIRTEVDREVRRRSALLQCLPGAWRSGGGHQIRNRPGAPQTSPVGLAAAGSARCAGEAAQVGLPSGALSSKGPDGASWLKVVEVLQGASSSNGRSASSKGARSPSSFPTGRRISHSARPGASHGRSAEFEEAGIHCVAVIDKNPDSACGVRFAGVPGSHSAADTVEEIVPHSIEALSLFFEDSKPARSRGLETVHERVADDIANDAVLTMISYIRDRRSNVRVKPSLEEGFLDTLDESARMRGVTRSAFVEKAATREGLARAAA